MTLEKFKKLSVSFMDVALRDHDVVTGVIDIIVEKAQAEPHFSRLGVILFCSVLFLFFYFYSRVLTKCCSEM